MSASLETVTPPRFACIFFESYADPPSDAGTCRTGEPDWKHFRRHLKIRHVCNCKSNCEISMHFPADHIKHILDLDKKGVLYHVSWTKMYRLAHPDAVRAPAPYLPTISQALAVARDPSEDFMKILVLNFADHGNTTQEEATKNALTFLRYLPVFHDTLSRTGSRPAGHIVAQTAIVDDHPSTPAFVADEGPLQLPTPAADDAPAHENRLDPDELSIDDWVFDETVHDGQEHMNFLDTVWDDHFAQHD